jgi:hypothetical protein
MPAERIGYFGWPSVTRMGDGTLAVGASGPRFDHICPWGKTSLFFSPDEGRSWSPPKTINNTPLDDRDVGIISLGGSKLLVTWFAHDIRPHFEWAKESYDLSGDELARWEAVFATWSDDVVNKWRNSWVRTSPDGESWSDFYPAPVNTPHGPILLANGELLYFGKQWRRPGECEVSGIAAARSTDEGKTWTEIGVVPLEDPELHAANLHEPHVVELTSGKLIGLIRHETTEKTKYGDFYMLQTESEDGGITWSPARYLDIYGSPPHLIRHSSGALVCTYSYRQPPLGHRVMISRDEGKTWDADWILRDDAPPRDHGYPCSVELPGGEVFTVYYQRASDTYRNCGVLWSRWKLPKG